MKIEGFGNQLPLNPNANSAQKPSGFSEVLKQYAQDINTEHHKAEKAAEKLAVTGEGSVSETLVAVQKADLSFQMLVATRNKLVDAYREVMRMQV